MVYLIKNQLADQTQPLGRLSTKEQITIEYHIEKQIQWLDKNSDASLDDIVKHKTQFEQIVMEIIHEIKRPGSASNDTQSSSHWNAGDL